MIVFLGWGSLVWNSGNLPIQSEWHVDGPLVKVEFKRQSSNGCLTLVLSDDSIPVNSLWAIYDGTEIDQAIADLSNRERCAIKYIGVWKLSEPEPKNILGISAWAENKGIVSVLWTDLPSKFNGENGLAPSLDEAINYLRQLDETIKSKAEEYIRNAPAQIRTEYRSKFETEFGWQ